MERVMRYFYMTEISHEIPDVKGWKIKEIFIGRPDGGDDEYFTLELTNEEGKVVGFAFDTKGNWYYGEEEK